MIKKVYLWTNGAVTVFDENGEQVERYQGMHAQVADLVLCNDTPETEYYLNSWQEAGMKKITRDDFKKGI